MYDLSLQRSQIPECFSIALGANSLAHHQGWAVCMQGLARPCDLCALTFSNKKLRSGYVAESSNQNIMFGGLGLGLGLGLAFIRKFGFN